MNYTLLLTPGGGYYWEFLVGVCRPVLRILSLFQSKKCHFPHPFSDQISKIHAHFRTETETTGLKMGEENSI